MKYIPCRSAINTVGAHGRNWAYVYFSRDGHDTGAPRFMNCFVSVTGRTTNGNSLRVQLRNFSWGHRGGVVLFLLSTSSKIRARFLFLAWSKLRLCSANHRPGYWSNLPCDWQSTAWGYSEQETENGPRQRGDRISIIYLYIKYLEISICTWQCLDVTFMFMLYWFIFT